MRLNDIRDNAGASRDRKRIGRGLASGTGKTSGQGQKGQKSRSGVSLLGFEGGQMPLYRRLPKRGFKNPFSKEYAIINIGDLQKAIDDNKIQVTEAVTGKTLVAAGLVGKAKNGVKLLGNGEIKIALEIKVAHATKSAIAAVEKAGGKVILPEAVVKTEGKRAKAKVAAIAKHEARFADSQ